VESAQNLDRLIQQKTRYVQEETEKRFGIKLEKVKFDIVAHSMGGLVARYYLRYGGADLPEDGSLPELTWAGARHVDHLILIGTPNAGSLGSLQNLISGVSPATLFPHYSAAVLGTMPSIYELLPRARHLPLMQADGQPVSDLFDPELWKNQQWGLADPEQDEFIKMLLPDIESPEQRLQIALDHQAKALRRARQFTSALDIPAKPPDSLKLLLIAGDAEETKTTAQIDPEGGIKIIQTGPGDGTVLRSSALMDERTADNRQSRLISPIHWDQVLFIFSDHLGLTKDPAFTDNVLYFLLESPRN
jgi:pimeloyl-ACP methyl ester carboxylesterase